MRNLLGRLNARSLDSLRRIARFWSIALPGDDRSRFVGALYRTMTDIRSVRQAWEQLDITSQRIVRELALSEADALPVEEIAATVALPVDQTRDALVRLFQAGILAREGDSQELPIGAVPKLFLPREMGLLFRRLQDEIDAGDLSRSSLRVLLEITDDADVEAAATRWGIRVIPGMRRRADLIDEILRNVSQPERIERLTRELPPDAAAIWSIVHNSGHDSGTPLEEVVRRVWPSGLSDPRDGLRNENRMRDALATLEISLLVMHAYRRDGTRRLFIPQEILHPGRVPTTLPLRPLQPLPPNTVTAPESRHPDALAWDLMTVLREIAGFGAPVWVPGEALSRSWQRRVNGRLWFGGSEIPPTGYLGFLLTLGLGVGVIEPAAETAVTITDRNAIRPALAPRVRSWRTMSFEDQTAHLKTAWLATDQWTEGREREEIDVWGADWRGFRHRLLEAVAHVTANEWVLIEDLGARLAEQNPALIGTTFTAASSRFGGDTRDTRVATVARIIAVEVETALSWFGLVELSSVPGRGTALRVTDAGREMGQPGGVPARPKEDGPVITAAETGTITLHRPAPIHVWSLTAFGDAETLRPEAVYQLRPGSIGRALGAGFDLAQISSYLEKQSGGPLPEGLTTLLRQWTVSYRRVRLRRAAIWYPDAPDSREELRRVAAESGMMMLDETTPDGGLIVLLPESGGDGATVEDDLLKALRAAGYVGQWSTSAARQISQSAAIEPSVTPAPLQRRPRRPRQT